MKTEVKQTTCIRTNLDTIPKEDLSEMAKKIGIFMAAQIQIRLQNQPKPLTLEVQKLQ